MTRAGDDKSEICRKSGCPGGCLARLADVAAPDALAAALKRVVRAAGGAGGDGQTAGGFARGGPAALARLSGSLVSGAYRPGSLRRFDIAKPDGRRRELAVPCVRDRIVQTALAEALDRQFDAGMSSGSFAYRKGLSVEHAAALATLWRLRGWCYAVDADIEDFFGRVDHGLLLAMLRDRRVCRRSLRLVRLWLEGYSSAGKGLPQGSPVSPVLSNLYLDPFDRTVETERSKLVRYADDFLILTRGRAEAEGALERARAALAKLKLDLNAAKTRIADLREGIDFLGLRLEGDRIGRR